MNLSLSITSDPHVPTIDYWADLEFVNCFSGGVGLSRNIVERSGIRALIFYKTISPVTVAMEH